VLLGGLVLIIGGAIDDKRTLRATQTIWFPLIASSVVLLSGIQISKLTNPFGGFFEISILLSSLIVFCWLMGAMYTTKLLDGADGLTSSVGIVAVAMMGSLGLTEKYFQPDAVFFSAVILGSFVGFFWYNKPTAKIYLGEGGSTLVGFLVGILAVISGSKVATALLVLGIPAVDLLRVMLERLRVGGVRQLFIADRRHLHLRLSDAGYSSRQVLLIYIGLSTSFGLSALFLQSREKLIALALLPFVLMLIVWQAGKRTHPSSCANRSVNL
jgi:UDP-GlcNAc:undecaprenyl-phosphate GlcNAc-1-phosphate transferase